MKDPFAIISTVELRDADETSVLEVPSGYQAWLLSKTYARIRGERLEAILRTFRCDCPRCRADAADMMAGRRIVKR